MNNIFTENSGVPKNWIEVLENNAQQYADSPAFVEQSSSNQTTKEISYSELSNQAKALSVLISKQTVFGDRVILVMPNSIDYIIGFFACVYAGVIAVTAYPPKNKKRDWHKLNAIMTDCKPAVVLYSSSQTSQINTWFNESDYQCSTLLISNENIDLAQLWKMPLIDENDLVYLQYSSGSTGSPKGVMLSHYNLLNNTCLIIEQYGITKNDKFINWLPLFHDMGFVGCVLTPILAQATTWLIPSATVALNPLSLLQLVTNIQGTIFAAPNFIFDLAVNRISLADKKRLDLKSLRIAANGSEPINAETLTNFSEYFRDCGLNTKALKPSYGMAEACLFVTNTASEQAFNILSVDKKQLRLGKIKLDTTLTELTENLACSGEINKAMQVKVVHQTTRSLLADSCVGELMIKGNSICQGYWQKPEINKKTFDQVVDSEPGFMATGDLGFIHENKLYVCGRSKEMFIVNGQNYYPQDIENTISTLSTQFMPHGGAIFELGTNKNISELVVVQELSRQGMKHPDKMILINEIQQTVAEIHELKLTAVVLLAPSSLPKTTSGKIQRVGCREAYLKNELPSVAKWQRPITDVVLNSNLPELNIVDHESMTQFIISWIALRLNVPKAQFNSESSLLKTGLDSIDGLTLTHELSSRLNCTLPSDLFWQYPIITDLVVYLIAQNINKSLDKNSERKNTDTSLEGVI